MGIVLDVGRDFVVCIVEVVFVGTVLRVLGLGCVVLDYCLASVARSVVFDSHFAQCVAKHCSLLAFD